MQTSLGTHLRQLRTQSGLSLNRLAQSAGVSQPTLSRWEAGKTLPRLAELDAVLMALQATVQQQQSALELLDAPRALRRVCRQKTPNDLPLERYAVTGGDLLRAMRLRKRLTLDVVARKIEVPKSTLSRWENGETWPSAVRLHSLCYTLGAQEEEIAALTCRRFFLGQSSNSLSDLLSQFEQIEKQAALGDNTLLDLQIFGLEARLLTLARKHTAALHLLVKLWSHYAQWLSWQGRSQESIVVAERVLELARAKTALPSASVMLAAAAAGFALSHSSPQKAVKMLQMWRTAVPTASHEQLVLDSEIGFVLVRPECPENPELLETTLSILEKRIPTQPETTHFHLHFFQRLRAEARLRQGYPEEAFALLPPLPRSLHSRVEELLLSVRMLIAMSEPREATLRLNDVYALIKDCDNQSYHEQAGTFAQQLYC